LNDQLRLLIELQQFDARILELRASMRALPDKLAPAKQNLAKLEALLQSEKDEFARTEAWRRDQEGILRQEDEAIKKAKAKLQSSSSGREFTAATRELDSKRRTMSEREEEVLKVIEAIETSRKSIAEHEADVDRLRSQLAAEEQGIASKVAELDGQVATLLGQRVTLAERIDPSLLKKYDTVVARRAVALVQVIDGSCQGCHMRLPPQLVNELTRQDSIELCPCCQRLLYRPDDERAQQRE
jgi:uncharacterized protein